MRVRGRPLIALAVFLASISPLLALNPSLDVSQYAHTSWKIRDGFPKGDVNSIAQTPDGWLWLGTEFGLVRFDGVASAAFQPPPNKHLPSDNIRSLLAARDGTLWIGTTKGLASWKNGRLTEYAELDGMSIGSMIEGREGVVWVGVLLPAGKLCAIRNERVRCYDDPRFAPGVFSFHQSANGDIWVGVAGGLLKWNPGHSEFYSVPDTPNGVVGWNEDSNGTLIFGVHSGIMRLDNGRIQPSAPGVAQKFATSAILRDRDGGLWIGTADRGLLHVHQGRTDLFDEDEGLTGNGVYSIAEDREGDIWVSTANGLDRFRDYAVATFSGSQGLSRAVVGAVLADRDGSVWISTIDGLNRWNRGKISVYRSSGGLPDRYTESLFQDAAGRIWIGANPGAGYLENGHFTPLAGTGGITHAFAQDPAGNIWIAHQQRGVLRLSPANQLGQVPLAGLPPNSIASALLADPARDGLWIGFFPNGLAWYRDGQVRAFYGTNEGLGGGQVAGLRLDSDGTLWADTAGGLSRLKNGRIITLNGRSGLPCDAVHWSMEDEAHSLWLYMPCGLVRIARSEVDAWEKDTSRTIRFTVFDSSDGVRTLSLAGGYTPHVSSSPNGKLWFTALDGLSVVDPLHLPINKLPPPVYVGQITADRKTYDPTPGRRLPPLVRDLEIDYTALSLVAPEKNRFKYKLEGFDRDWQDAGNRRQAFYTNLSPGDYRFRVQASNNSGVWNEAGASFDFAIDPAWYQTIWFQAACAAAFGALLWGLYRYRLHQIAQQFNQRLEGRVEERTRVARELHDTLLQSFQGLMLRLQVVAGLIPEGKAKDELEKTLERGDQAIIEGRNAVHDLRSSTSITNELAEALKDAGDELAAEGGAAFRLTIEGAARELRPIIRDEIYRIAREALRNAFRHAQAQRIEAEITYSDSALRLRIRDDGRGIPEGTLKEGAAGHYGLAGMRERAAAQAGAKLNIWSRIGAGTEVDLSIPGSIAYAEAPGRSRMKLFRRKAG